MHVIHCEQRMISFDLTHESVVENMIGCPQLMPTQNCGVFIVHFYCKPERRVNYFFPRIELVLMKQLFFYSRYSEGDDYVCEMYKQ